MGCCNSSVPGPAFHRYFNSVAKEDLLIISTSNPNPCSINDPITIIEDISLNPLGLAVYYNNVNRFKVLKQAGAKVSSLEDLLSMQGLSSFDIILKKNHQEMLEIFLPVFLLEVLEIDQYECLNRPLILTAVRQDNLKTVKFLHEYFSEVVPPLAFDIHAVDQSGDNSAIIACRNNNLSMVKYLHQTCGVDFTVKNKQGQSAVEVARQFSDCSEVFKYLSEKINSEKLQNLDLTSEKINSEKLQNLDLKYEDSELDFSYSTINEKSDNQTLIINQINESLL